MGEELDEFGLRICWKMNVWNSWEVEEVWSRRGDNVDDCEVGYLDFVS